MDAKSQRRPEVEQSWGRKCGEGAKEAAKKSQGSRRIQDNDDKTQELAPP